MTVSLNAEQDAPGELEPTERPNASLVFVPVKISAPAPTSQQNFIEALEEFLCVDEAELRAATEDKSDKQAPYPAAGSEASSPMRPESPRDQAGEFLLKTRASAGWRRWLRKGSRQIKGTPRSTRTPPRQSSSFSALSAQPPEKVLRSNRA